MLLSISNLGQTSDCDLAAMREGRSRAAALNRGKSCVIDRLARRVWGAGRVILLGDAIHATTPNLGQGACQAVEDAAVLADSLRRCSSPEAGLRIYEAAAPAPRQLPD